MTSASSWRDGIRRSLSRPDDHVIVLFGATGDLARRKLLPGLFHFFAAGLLPGKCRIIGSARRALTSQQFREHARQLVAEFGTTKPAGEAWGAFERALSFGSAVPGDAAPLCMQRPGGLRAPHSRRHLGDQALFTRADGVERLWDISAPLLENPPPIEPYAPGSWGPEPALRRLAAPFRWRLPGAGSPS